MSVLKRPYLKVEHQGEIGYGGNQSWLPYRFMQRSGCGVIAAADLLFYLRGKKEAEEKEYQDFAKLLCMKYLPVIPGFGMNGFTLMLGLNRYFRNKKLPYRASWRFSGKKMLGRLDEMLGRDIPVIFSVGPNFPKFWGKHQVNFYRKTSDGNYVPATKTKAHFVTVTGRDGLWLHISSWGKEYYIDLNEYREYVKNFSCSLVSNILYVRKTKKQ